MHTARQVAWPIILYLFIGIMNSLSMKFSYVIEAKGLPQLGYHDFQKPWFIILVAFFGQSLITIVYVILKSKKINKFPEDVNITDLNFLQFLIFAIPAVADVFESIASAVTIAYIGPSIDAMLKSFTLVGASLISRFYFRRHFLLYKWVGISLVIGALIIVACAGIFNASLSSTIQASPAVAALIIMVKIISQLGYAAKISFEEFFTQINGFHPMMISGIEGCWCTIIIAFICLPIAQYMPGEEGNGIHEDTLDTFLMLKHSPTLIVLVCIMFLLGLVYSFVSITVIQRTSAVTQTIWKAFRTFLIWITQFVIFYTFKTNKTLYPYRLAGEEWVGGSYMKLAGFIIMIFGIFCYNKIPKYPCFTYTDKDEVTDKSFETTCENSKVTNSTLIGDEIGIPPKKKKKIEDDDNSDSSVLDL